MDRDRVRLEREMEKIFLAAEREGLSFYEMRFELCPADILHAFGAYGMPSRFSHWSFGKSFQKIKTQYDYNLIRIYELVVNSDPCYAFLLDSNSFVQNALVVAHVIAHCDFFKNNYRFLDTNRRMIESMASNAERIRGYEFRYGRQRVEEFLDAALSIQEHIDPYHCAPSGDGEEGRQKQAVQSPYEDLWTLEDRSGEGDPSGANQKAARGPVKDLLLFIMEHARHLEDWQRDVLSIVREEMLYFWPQMETKIMNEGWASFWHSRLIRELDLSDAEVLESAKMHAAVVQASGGHLNPYHVGLRIFEDIKRRWDEPCEEEKSRYGRRGGEGMAKLFEVRATETDASFLRNYLTRELVEELDLYLYRKVGSRWQVVSTDWEHVRDSIVASMTNCGYPYIVVEDGDYRGNGELYLKHLYEGVELHIPHLEKTLRHVYTLWGRPVHIETVVDDKATVFSYDGSQNTSETK